MVGVDGHGREAWTGTGVGRPAWTGTGARAVAGVDGHGREAWTGTGGGRRTAGSRDGGAASPPILVVPKWDRSG